MTYILIKFECDFCDDFDVHGFKLMQREEWERYVNNIPESPGLMEYYFGTNEAFEWEEKSDYLSCFKIADISDTDAEVIKRLFTDRYGEVVNGVFPIFEEYWYVVILDKPETVT